MTLTREGAVPYKRTLLFVVCITALLYVSITKCSPAPRVGSDGTDTTETSMTYVDTGTTMGTTDVVMTADTMSTDTVAWPTETSATGMVATTTDDVVTSTSRPQPQTQHPPAFVVRRTRDLYFNGWIEPRNVASPEPLARAEVTKTYTFTADLGQWLAESAFPGATSLQPGPELQREIESAPSNRQVLNAYVRPILLGRGLRLLGGKLKVETWRGGAWQPLDSVDEMVPFDIDLARMRERMQSDDVQFAPEDLRFAGIRFGVRAMRRGCAAVALSVWNEDRTIPLDNIVFPVAIGDVECPSRRSPKASGLTRLLFEEPDMTYDAALHVFEYELSSGSAESVAVLVPATPTPDCTHFVWNPTRAISKVVTTAAFKQKLDDARKNNRYSVVGELLKDHLFADVETDSETCGSQRALEYLVKLTETEAPRIFVRLVNTANEPFFMPAGLVFMAKVGGQRVFRHTPVIAQPLPRQSYELGDRCVSDLAFAVPTSLHGPIPTFTLVSSPLFHPIDKIADLEEFMRRSNEKAVALVLLAHHGDGFVYFDDPIKQWDVEFLSRRFAQGSIAMLSTCSAGDLRNMELRLVRGLNEAGVDAMILSSFDVKPPVGVALAKYMTAGLLEARSAAQPILLAEIFATARKKTIAELTPLVGAETAEGYLSEFSLAGNGGIRICGKEM